MPVPANHLSIIGVSTIDDHDAVGVHLPRYSINQSYVKAVEAAGGVPLLIPQLEDPAALRRIYEMLDGLMLPGGVDIHPSFYGQEPHSSLDPTDVGLDHVETTMLSWALEDDLPVLGICRGEQVLNVVMGGTLIQDIYTQYPTSIDHRESARRRIRDYLAHDIAIDPASRLREIVGEDRVWVNTAHHQAIDKIASGLVATAWAPDGIVEGVESPGHRFVIAVQCHPEMLWRKNEWAGKLFRAFVEAVDAWAADKQPNGHSAPHSRSMPALKATGT